MSGFNFRGTAGYVADDAGSTYVLTSDVYPVTRSGLTFGWSSAADFGIDRSTNPDPRLSGMNRSTNVDSLSFITTSGAGVFNVSLAIGQQVGAVTGNKLYITEVNSSNVEQSVLATVADGVNTDAGEFIDATGVVRTSPADWVNNQSTVEVTVADGNHLAVRLGDGVNDGTKTHIAHFSYESATPSLIPRRTIDATDWFIHPNSPRSDGNYTDGPRASAVSAISMSLSLTTAGRLGFFIDYSELSDAGTHTFYVARTHGSTGAVSVAYATSGDGHTSVSGVLSWADEDMSIQSFTVAVTPAQLTNHQTTLGLGEHRIVARLSNPTNSAVLHFGAEETKAYGVIDNNVLASDANALFYDADAATNGVGTQADPYNSAVDALQDMGNKRYLYGKGTTIVDGAYIGGVYGSAMVKCLPPPPSRTGESTRAYVRNWSGSTWEIQGNGTDTDVAGFFTDSGESYHTYKGIDFANFDTTDLDGLGAATDCFSIYYQYGDSVSINMEQCTTDNINGGGNTGAYMPWGVDGCKVWRCTGSNITRFGIIFGANAAVFETYDGKNISMQRCEGSNANHLMHHKRVGAPFDVSTSVRFCKDTTLGGVLYGRSGLSGVPHSYSITQCNIFLPVGENNTGISHEVGQLGSNGSFNAEKHWWCNNVFDERGGGESAPIDFRQAYKAAIFNNIYFNSVRLWRERQDSSSAGEPIEYANHELHFGTTLTSQTYEYQVLNYATAELLQVVRPDFATEDVIADPLFNDAPNGDYTLGTGSPALTGGVDGTQQGAYLGNFYTIGAAN